MDYQKLANDIRELAYDLRNDLCQENLIDLENAASIVEEGHKIYVIMTMTHCEEENGKWTNFGHTRAVGYYTKEEDAINCVLNNVCDLWETIYKYAMIEEVKEGLYGSACMRTWWFKWNKELEKYEPMEKPEFAKNSFGFIIG